MGNNGKKQCAEQSKQADIRARVYVRCERLRSSDVVACGRWRPDEKRPPTRAGDNAHKSETRISTIPDFTDRGKRKKKALPLFPRARRHERQFGRRPDSPPQVRAPPTTPRTGHRARSPPCSNPRSRSPRRRRRATSPRACADSYRMQHVGRFAFLEAICRTMTSGRSPADPAVGQTP
jgi:hypothetical protein